MKGTVLIVDDDRAMCEMLEFDLSRRGFEVQWQADGEHALTVLHESDMDVVLSDINLPGMTGIDLCERITSNRPDIPVITITAFGNLETAIASIRAGAYDFVVKPIDMDLLEVALDRAIAHRVLQEKVKVLSLAGGNVSRSDTIIGNSPVIDKLISQIDRIADTDISVLITGESGTGKELVAKALHQQSRRHQAPFIPVNCSALPETLLESELFGHKQGAFTDAKKDRKGLFQEAAGGTIFLDEVGDLPLPLQPKLLRVLEEHCVRPLGDIKEHPVDVRILAATNQDLEAAVKDGRFREDLFYRLNVMQMEVSPLRSRGTDVLLLAAHFVRHFAEHLDKQVVGISDNAAEKLIDYSWPGNVRELRNAMERATVLTRFEKIMVDDLPPDIRAYKSNHLFGGFQDPDALPSMEEMERRYILHVLKSVGDNRTVAANILKIDRKTLYRKLRRYNIAST